MIVVSVGFRSNAISETDIKRCRYAFAIAVSQVFGLRGRHIEELANFRRQWDEREQVHTNFIAAMVDLIGEIEPEEFTALTQAFTRQLVQVGYEPELVSSMRRLRGGK